ncbi:MAG: ATP-binding cassette domain-containing protein, partial [Spirochaetales bacterium]|nr:ATP-binding cassette domain-containing protein [Spirochaetales bacterium]
MSEHSFLRVENLSVTFPPKDARLGGPVFAVRGVSWTLEKGEILGIVGESGSGKSVSTSAIPSLLPAHAEVTGDIFLEGKQLVGLPK